VLKDAIPLKTYVYID